MHVGVLHSRIRADERALFDRLEMAGHEYTRIDTREIELQTSSPPAELAAVDVVLDRTVATSHGLYATKLLELHDIQVVNEWSVAATCADKVATSAALVAAGIDTPDVSVSFSIDSALAAAESFGYPCVLKPVVGSWGRLLAKIDSSTTAEALFEHKQTLGHYEHGIFYLQEFVDKPGRDLRVVTVGGEPIAAMARSSDHWITNAATGATVSAHPIDDELASIATAASAAVGGGILGIDLMETDDGYTVHEINHVVEFRAIDGVASVDVPAAIIEYLETVVEQPSAVTAS